MTEPHAPTPAGALLHSTHDPATYEALMDANVGLPNWSNSVRSVSRALRIGPITGGLWVEKTAANLHPFCSTSDHPVAAHCDIE